MRRPLRLLSVIGALGAGSLALSACDASPYAATVNGQVISVNNLNHQLAEWSSNRVWVRAFDAGNAQNQGGDGTTVVGTGGSGTYSSKFAADILAVNVDVAAIHQHLAATGHPATHDQVVAARAINEYLRAQYWDKFPTQLRDFLVEQLADQGALAAVPANPSSLQGPFNQIQPYLFSSVCVQESTAFSSAAAQAIISSGTLHGPPVCYDQAAIESQSPAFQAAVIKLANVGDISPAIRTPFGFEVLKLASRSTPGFDAGVQQVLSSATSQPTSINRILASAHVKVNPAYGSWSAGQITPPPSPLS